MAEIHQGLSDLHLGYQKVTWKKLAQTKFQKSYLQFLQQKYIRWWFQTYSLAFIPKNLWTPNWFFYPSSFKIQTSCPVELRKNPLTLHYDGGLIGVPFNGLL